MASHTKEQLQAAFDRIDVDKNGAVDIGELQALLAAVEIPTNNVTLWNIMAELDTEMPFGQVSFEEFYNWTRASHHANAGMGDAPTIPGPENWNDRLDLVDARGSENSCIRHDVQGSTLVSDEEVHRRYPMGKKLGEGKYASVHLCTDTETGEKKAMKVFKKKVLMMKKGPSKAKYFYEIIQEANKMRRVQDHPNIVKLYDLLETPQQLLVLIECVSGGQLYDGIIKRRPSKDGTGIFSERMAGKVIGQLTDAIRYMHQQGVLHCDLKPENVLCTHSPTEDGFDIKVADMGLSKVIEKGVYQKLSFCGTPLYMAPEMLRKEQYSYPVDIWSIGCMMHELLCGEPPFTGTDMGNLKRNVTTIYKGLFAGEDKQSLRIKKHWKRYGVSASAQDLIGHLLEPDPVKRITAADAMSMDWLAKNEELSPDHMPDVHLNLKNSTEKRKFVRAVMKIVASQKIARLIKHPHSMTGGKHEHSPNKSGRSSTHKDEDNGCACTIS